MRIGARIPARCRTPSRCGERASAQDPLERHLPGRRRRTEIRGRLGRAARRDRERRQHRHDHCQEPCADHWFGANCGLACSAATKARMSGVTQVKSLGVASRHTKPLAQVFGPNSPGIQRSGARGSLRRRGDGCPPSRRPRRREARVVARAGLDMRRQGRRLQLGEGWHSNENPVRFWHSLLRMPKEAASDAMPNRQHTR